jgi:hypothetical protein
MMGKPGIDESLASKPKSSTPFSFFVDKFWLVYGREGKKLYPLLV